MERIGIYGGAFNPPHVGHLRAAEYAQRELQLSKLLLVPSGTSPHKALPPNSPTADQRLQMLRLAAREQMEVSDLEVVRGGISYTYMTVEQLKQQYPDQEMVLLMGTDMFLSFGNWKEPERIWKNASLGVFYRGEPQEIQQIQQQKEKMESAGATVYLVKNPVNRISSTQLRRMLAFRCGSEFLPNGVETYIWQNGLYDTAEDYRKLPMEQLEQVAVRLLKPNRVAHVLGCRDTAAALAKHWGADETDAARAGLLHDITKALDGPLQLTLCREYGIVLSSFFENNPKTLHALTGSLVAERIFGENTSVVAAIRSHTTGKAKMNLLEKIIYVADYMEPNRDFPGVEDLRRLAFENLDQALKLGLTMTLQLLKTQGREISPESAQALAYLEETGV
ncbi:MAG: nicotinate (nicotinamide) nucleotide adenylyltransferase [Oscillospiraceae bacterium]|nr:nicotinate (nicotinamide) nucleotide adenylyltransferase [Oscillospiraceae bacterium]